MTEKRFAFLRWAALSNSFRRFGFEFLSIFIAVISAFALNNWNTNRRDAQAEQKILAEIESGIQKDREDIEGNIKGHQNGIAAAHYFRKLINGMPVVNDSLWFYYHSLTRDFILLQNVSGYETLKSKGLELIQDDSLRNLIISIYEYDYRGMKNLEEEYDEMQFYEHYFKPMNEVLSPYFYFNAGGSVDSIQQPLPIQESDKKNLLVYLDKIRMGRLFMINSYEETLEKLNRLELKIEAYQTSE